MHTQTTINVQGENQAAYEIYADETKEQTIGFVFDETTACLLIASKDLLTACKIGLEYINQANKCSKPDCFVCMKWKQDKKAILEAIAKAEGK